MRVGLIQALGRMGTSELRHTLLGIAAAALAAPTAFFMYGLLTEPTEFSVSDVFVAAFIVYFYGLVVSMPVSLIFGLPYVLGLQKRGRLNWLYVCSAAATAGTVAFIGLWALDFQQYQPLWVFAGLGLVSGLLSGVAFCAVVRPNNSFKPNPLRGSA